MINRFVLAVHGVYSATQQAVVRVWRRPANAVPPKLDAQGKSRIYLEESRKQAEANKLGAVPMYAAQMKMEGVPCAK